MSKKVDSVVEKMQKEFESHQDDLTLQEYFEACEELASDFETRMNAARDDLSRQGIEV